VRQAGTNLKLSIVTAAVPALGGDCDEPLDVGCGDALGFAAPCALRRTTNSLDRTGAGMPARWKRSSIIARCEHSARATDADR
jgi:hypothetical protein